ncbi:MAG: SDR family NAD(P)-dependent oxidoreductase [Chitinophagaceae bacterium]|nr:MAG: SDR family NAD(P)-dependent oxidoreductase [Chitinophagaceae bacterium]
MKTVIITGANGNLGTAVTRFFLDKEYLVIATVANETMKTELAVAPQLDVHVVNLADETTAANFVAAVVAKYHTIDAALLLVGGFAMGSVADTSSADIDQQVSLNFKTAYHVARPLFQHMLAKGQGRLVFIGARPALEPSAGKNLVAYGLSKSLLFTLADYMNEEAKGKNVTATVVAPSTLDTALNRKSMPDVNPDSWVKPEALAAILEFIVSDAGAPLREAVYKVYNNA